MANVQDKLGSAPKKPDAQVTIDDDGTIHVERPAEPEPEPEPKPEPEPAPEPVQQEPVPVPRAVSLRINPTLVMAIIAVVLSFFPVTLFGPFEASFHGFAFDLAAYYFDYEDPIVSSYMKLIAAMDLFSMLAPVPLLMAALAGSQRHTSLLILTVLLECSWSLYPLLVPFAIGSSDPVGFFLMMLFEPVNSTAGGFGSAPTILMALMLVASTVLLCRGGRRSRLAAWGVAVCTSARVVYALVSSLVTYNSYSPHISSGTIVMALVGICTLCIVAADRGVRVRDLLLRP